MNRFTGLLCLFSVLALLPIVAAADDNIPALPDAVDSTASYHYTLKFQEGWNLFSVPIGGVSSVKITSTTCAVHPIYYYTPVAIGDATPANSYTQPATMQVGDSLSPGYGYYYKADSDCSMTVTGTGVSQIEGKLLYAGWNQIGASYKTLKFSDIVGNCNVISGPYRFDTNAYKLYRSGQTSVTVWVKTDSLEKGQGYFVSVSDSCNLGTQPPQPPITVSKVTIEEFSDFQCPYCKQSQVTLKQLETEYGDKIQRVFRNFPLSQIHPQAEKAAEAAECARDQGKFEDYRDILFAHQDALYVGNLKAYAANLGLNTATFNTCLDSGIKAAGITSDYQEGLRRGVTGTPTFFFNGGNQLSGAQAISQFEAIINKLLAGNQTQLPDLTISVPSIGTKKVGDYVTIPITVKNIGLAAASSSILQISGAGSAQYTVPTLNPGDSRVYYYSFTVTQTDHMQFVITADSQGSVVESNEYNNVYTLDIYPQSTGTGFDLGVQSITFSNNQPQVGDSVTITAVLYNYGNKGGYLRGYGASYETGSGVTGGGVAPKVSGMGIYVGPGQTYTLTYTNSFQIAGLWKVTVAISPDGDINSANDQLTSTIYVGTPNTKGFDPAVTSITFDNNNPTAGQTFGVKVLVQNLGDIGGYISAFDLYYSGGGQGTNVGGGYGFSEGGNRYFAPGGSYTYTSSSQTMPTGGTWTASASIVAINDINTGNNLISKSIYVTPIQGNCVNAGDGTYTNLAINCPIRSASGYIVKLMEVSAFSPYSAHFTVSDLNNNIVTNVYLQEGQSTTLSVASNLYLQVNKIHQSSYANGATVDMIIKSYGAPSPTPVPCIDYGDGRYSPLAVNCLVNTVGGFKAKLVDVSAFSPLQADFQIMDSNNNLIKTIYIAVGTSIVIPEANNLYIRVDGITPGAYATNAVVDVTFISNYQVSPTPIPSAPYRYNGYPTGTFDPTYNIVLKLNTNVKSICKFSSTPGVTFNSISGNTFLYYPTTSQNPEGTWHYYSLGTLSPGSYNFYVKCADMNGVANLDDFPISFAITSPSPTPIVTPTPSPNANNTPFTPQFYDIYIRPGYSQSPELIKLFDPADRWRFIGYQWGTGQMHIQGAEDALATNTGLFDWNDVGFDVLNAGGTVVTVKLTACETAAYDALSFKYTQGMAKLVVSETGTTLQGGNPEIQLWPQCQGHIGETRTVNITPL